MNLHPLFLAACISSAFVRGSVQAQDTFGAEFHLRAFYDTDGINAERSEPSEDTSRFGIESKAAKISFQRQVNDRVSVRIRYNMLSNKLEYGYLRLSMSPSLSVSVGRNKERIYGWHRRLTGSISPVLSDALNLRAFSYPDGVQVEYQSGDQKFLVQLVEDTFSCKAQQCNAYNSFDENGDSIQKQPAVISEWRSKIMGLESLVQIASYDQAHSLSSSFGLHYRNNKIDTHLDYTIDQRAQKDSVDTTKVNKVKINSYVWHIEWKNNDLTPFAQISAFDVYTPESNPQANTSIAPYDNNNRKLAFGSYLDSYGKAFRPYGLIAQTSAKQLEVATSETKSQSKLELNLGLSSIF